MASVPKSRLYYFAEQCMHFKVMVTLRAARGEVERSRSGSTAYQRIPSVLVWTASIPMQ
jgi:hypothetical protein